MSRLAHRLLLLAVTVLAFVAAACSGAATPTPPAASPDADATLDAFYDAIADPDSLSFHLRQTAELENLGAPLVSAEYDLDVSGSSFAGAASAGGGGMDIGFDIIVIGDDGWLRLEGEDWTEVPASELSPEDILDIWRYVAPRDDFSLESVDADGALHFRSTTPLPYETASMRTSGLTGQIVDSELVLRPDGTPVALMLELEGSGTFSGQALELTGTTDIEFSKWGEDITVEAPTD